MACRLDALCILAADPAAAATFWAGVLGWKAAGASVKPPDDLGIRLRFLPSATPKTQADHIHHDLRPAEGSTRQAELDRLLELGATRLSPEFLLDPDGREFRLLPA